MLSARARRGSGHAMSNGTAEEGAGRRSPRGAPGGFTLIEMVVSILITLITVVGLAHLFGSGRALINHYEVARAAGSAAQQRLEVLARTGTSADLSIGSHP